LGTEEFSKAAIVSEGVREVDGEFLGNKMESTGYADTEHVARHV
jgi:hypothetical protein